VPGVYLSYPFCAQKCTYCNFASGVFPAEWESRYLDRLERELSGAAWPWSPETVYWGGGTPSLMEADRFRRLMDLIPGRPWREATVEAAPGSVTPGRAALWAECGIGRVSLGVQSFVEAEIRRTGRKHTAAIVEREVAQLRDAGIAEINLDLIAGLAGQTEDSWAESLDRLLALDCPHASIYLLEVDDDSRLGKELLLGGVRYGAFDVPGEESLARFYERAVDRLEAAGLSRYEISNFARPGRESAHNLKYWRREPYLGFGADAHSFDGGRRWANAESVPDYIERDDPRIEDGPAIEAEERYFLGLRLRDGIPHEGVPVTEAERAGLLERRHGRLRLTPRGVLLSNEVFAEFLP
jgi:oxygen-independent coproporphyrinogen-3 oxidase